MPSALLLFHTLSPLLSSIDCIIFNSLQNKFFGDQPAIDVLTKNRNALLGVATNDDGKQVEDGARNPPWVQCCLKSYYRDKSKSTVSNIWHSIGGRLGLIVIVLYVGWKLYSISVFLVSNTNLKKNQSQGHRHSQL